ncbi:hypothetical protein ACOSP7_032447 [Xanthoceras sorbifolium]
MATTLLPLILSIALVFLVLNFHYCHAAADHQPRQVYIVFVDPSMESAAEAVNLKFLQKVLEGSTPGESLVYSYRNFNAFSASLTEKEAKKLQRLKGILQVQPSQWSHLDSSSTGAPVESHTAINIGEIDG